MSIREWITIAAIGCLLAPAPASALDPKVRLTQYRHTAWRVQDGYFAAAPNAIAQTADGYIWIGTGAGLVRYDGVRFAPWIRPGETLPFSAAVYSLLSSSDGTLWIGTAARLVQLEEQQARGARPRPHQRDHRGSQASHLGGAVAAAGCGRRLVPGRRRATEMHRRRRSVAPAVCGDAVRGSSTATCGWASRANCCDGARTRIRATFESNWRGSRGSRRWRASSRMSDGSVWAAIPREGFGVFRIVQRHSASSDVHGRQHRNVNALFVDRDQSVWMGTSNDGIYRVSGGRLDQFRSEGGLSSNAVTGFFEDREGNLWVATSKGLDRFRDTRVVTFSTAEGLAADLAGSVLAADDGRVWIGNQGGLDVVRRRPRDVDSHPGTERHLALAGPCASGSGWVSTTSWPCIRTGSSRKSTGLDGGTAHRRRDRDHRGSRRQYLGQRRRRQAQAAAHPRPRRAGRILGRAGSICASARRRSRWRNLAGAARMASSVTTRAASSKPSRCSRASAPVSGLMVEADGSVWASNARRSCAIGRIGEVTHADDAGTACRATRSSAPFAIVKRHCGCTRNAALIAIENAELERWSERPDRDHSSIECSTSLTAPCPGPALFSRAFRNHLMAGCGSSTTPWCKWWIPAGCG